MFNDLNRSVRIYFQVKVATKNGHNGPCVLRHVVVVSRYEQDNVEMVLIPVNVPKHPVRLNLVTRDYVQVCACRVDKYQNTCAW